MVAQSANHRGFMDIWHFLKLKEPQEFDSYFVVEGYFKQRFARDCKLATEALHIGFPRRALMMANGKRK
jgi:hypothetical protein